MAIYFFLESDRRNHRWISLEYTWWTGWNLFTRRVLECNCDGGCSVVWYSTVQKSRKTFGRSDVDYNDARYAKLSDFRREFVQTLLDRSPNRSTRRAQRRG